MWYDGDMKEEILNINSWKPTLTRRGAALAYRISMMDYNLCAHLFYDIFKQFGYSRHLIRLANTATFEILMYVSHKELEEALNNVMSE